MLGSLAAVDELTIGLDHVALDEIVVEVVRGLGLVLHVTAGRRRFLGERRARAYTNERETETECQHALCHCGDLSRWER